MIPVQKLMYRYKTGELMTDEKSFYDIYNIHAHFMMERKGIEIFKKITQCELLLLNYNLFLSFDISILKNNELFVFNIFHL